MNRRPTYRIVFDSIGAALIAVLTLLLFTVGLIAEIFAAIWRSLRR